MDTISSKRIHGFREKYNQQRRSFSQFIEWLHRQTDFEVANLRVATREEEARSIDLSLTMDGRPFTIEVKTEFAASSTGNLCFEVISQARVKERGVIGWGFKLESTDWITYILPSTGDLYIFDTDRLQKWIIANYQSLRNFSARNPDYFTLGVLMPITRVKELCRLTGNLSDQGG